MISLSKSLKKVGSLGSRRGLGFFSSFSALGCWGLRACVDAGFHGGEAEIRARGLWVRRGRP